MNRSISPRGYVTNPDYKSKLFSKAAKLYRTRTGYSQPGWKGIILAGGDATTPMTGQFSTLDDVVDGQHWFQLTDHWTPQDKTIYTVKFTGNVALYGGLPVDNNQHQQYNSWLSSSTADNRALVKFLNGVRAATTRYEGGVFLGELRESLKMIKNPAKGLTDRLDRYRRQVGRHKRQNPKSWTKSLSEIWLENAFGWQPLVNDIESAYELYTDQMTKVKSAIVRKTGAETQEIASWRRNNYLQYSDDGYTPFLVNSRTLEKVKVAYYGVVDLKAKTTYVDTLKTWGLSSDPLDWAPTAWELLPWSFLIEYFSNIGDVISASTACVGDLRWWNKRTIQSLTTETQFVLASLPTLKTAYSGAVASGAEPSSYKLSTRKVNRSLHPLLETPRLEFELSTLARQFANMGALMAACSKDIHPQRPSPRRRGNPLRFQRAPDGTRTPKKRM